ncbi:hypothetical protein K493DRAFT_321452 [Basidiobolus meristosporus CBS 931.73]|uniref:Uncharacterized protein n=1 Tax=Basidiobolus meristosporus CBS 931.73 TaxID=1314790 RepID=A0A1Y1WUI5_9FUNG|nr:hypothetical protein K493DRAFT_321452 [Basidiobolus meristosporus CBS 931.73]|eukprot:ORX77065.1 hypothetical protein K493DRAFT_321452 [Basidiobolus meristosporus CBS 931.73]
MLNISFSNPIDVAATLLILAIWFFGRPYLKRYLENDVKREQTRLKQQMEEQERFYKEQLAKETETHEVPKLTDEESKEFSEETPLTDKKTN